VNETKGTKMNNTHELFDANGNSLGEFQQAGDIYENAEGTVYTREELVGRGGWARPLDQTTYTD
jgi:hypothetical protein